MSLCTGVEFGPHSCTLVRGRRRGEGIELSAAHILDPPEWPPQASAAAELLKRVRQEKNLPRVARVVAWGLAEGAGPRDVATRAALRPLISAGFRIDAVMSPPQALAILAAYRPRPNAAAAVWLGINRHGAAIAIVRGADLLYSRSFGWNWEGAAIGSQAQLLQRYSIVAHLAPEVRRGIEVVRAKQDVRIEAAVTCGDYPDLRSLTMPLIEELDLEVETLDSVEGLILPPTARREHLPDSLSAVRLAGAAAAGRLDPGVHVDPVRLARAAGYAVAIASLAWIGYVWWARPEPSAPPELRADRNAATPPTGTTTTPSQPLPPAPEQAGASAPPLTRMSGQSGRAVVPAPAPAPSRRSGESAPPGAVTPPTRPTASQRPPAAPPVASTGTSSPPVTATSPAPQTESTAPRVTRPAPLRDPLPVIDTILVSSDRRLAVVDGAVVGVGDTLGQRTVARIEVDAVFLREPSGLEIRVPIRIRRAP